MSIKYYNVTVNGETYNVAVEEANAGIAPTTIAAPIVTQVSAPSVQAAPTPAPVAAQKATVGAGELIKAPINGTILSVNVNSGENVKKGQILCILEAMKMENEIMAPADGKITSVIAQKGAAVNAGDTLFTVA